MLKLDALKSLGGTVTAAADAIGITPSAVSQWPDVLPQPIIDRVLAALYRKENGIPPPERKPAAPVEA